ncbi:MAG: hypothetical protein N4A50_09710 [Vallitalea sp.]|jgi:hypothetical protein|nr:hypothetical protein [Vallitalea sp.]
MIKKLMLIFGILIVVIYIIMLIPRDFNKTYEGVKYRLGDKGNITLEKVTIEFKGEVFRDLILKEKFRGKLKINDFIIPQKECLKESFVIDFEYHNRIKIEDLNLDRYANRMKRTFYGDLYMNRSRKKLSIVVLEDGKWSSEDGLIISAPSTTREEALEITNELMRHMLDEDFTEFE